mmetsp:Transcript_54350/g.106358  ORF Transcript_54350/g.106358 Transcript_54350/m.106358 type:complete len:84 (-) Transcript_54350:636-887(-)
MPMGEMVHSNRLGEADHSPLSVEQLTVHPVHSKPPKQKRDHTQRQTQPRERLASLPTREKSDWMCLVEQRRICQLCLAFLGPK